MLAKYEHVFGTAVAFLGGAAMAAVCVWSIWRYLANVGFSEQGGWRVDRRALWRYVYPLDIAALATTVAALVLGAVRASGS
ncbi:MAG: hypothetical protein WD314_06530 [Trueperaceae bacterium]